MTKESGGFSCAIGSWALAAGAGFLAFVLLIVLGGYGFYGAAFLSAVLFAALGFLFSSIFCSSLPAPGTVKPGQERGLRAEPPKDFAAVSVGYAHAKRKAEEDGTPLPPNPYEDKTQAAPAAAATAAPVTPPQQTTEPAKAASAAPAAATTAAPAKAAPSTAPAAKAAAEKTGDAAGAKPDLLSAPRDGGADDLKKIKGVGPKLEQALNEMGVYHFDQIAGWSADEVAWMDENLVQFKGRVSRDDWVSQAKDLAKG